MKMTELSMTTLFLQVLCCIFKDDEQVDDEALLAQWDPYNIPILSEKKGVISFEDMLPGVTTKVERDASGW